MSGFLGFGRSGGEEKASGNLDSVFNYALPTAQASGQAGQAALGQAGDAFSKMLTAGRQETAQSSAPAVNAAEEQADARRKQQATMGTGRTGGTAELNREAGATTDATVDNIINQNLVGQREKGAEGLAKVGSTELANLAQLLGIGSGTQQSALQNAISKEGSQSSAFSHIFSAFL